MWFRSGSSRIVVIIWCSNWINEEEEDFAVNLCLLEILEAVGKLCLARDETSVCGSDDGPIFGRQSNRVRRRLPDPGYRVESNNKQSRQRIGRTLSASALVGLQI